MVRLDGPDLKTTVARDDTVSFRSILGLRTKSQMQEVYQFLDLNGEHVFCGLHRPAQPASLGVVMCHPLGEEKLWSHRVFVSFARELAAAGIAALRFDFRGEGDSDRDFQEADLESRVQDACLAIDSLRELNPSIREVTLLGLRLGASVATTVAARRNDVARLLLWDPVVDGAAYMQAVLRLNLMYQMAIHRRVVENREMLVARLAQGETINIEGYEVAEPLYRQVTEFRLQDVLSQFSGKVVLLQVNQGVGPVKPEFSALAEVNPSWRVEVVQEEPFWREITTLYQRAPNLTRASLTALGVSS